MVWWGIDCRSLTKVEINNCSTSGDFSNTNGGTPKWGWLMVYHEKSYWNGWFGIAPISGNLQIQFDVLSLFLLPAQNYTWSYGSLSSKLFEAKDWKYSSAIAEIAFTTCSVVAEPVNDVGWVKCLLISGRFSLLSIIPVTSQWGHYNPNDKVMDGN